MGTKGGLHFEFFSAGGGLGFDFVGFLLKDRERKRVVGVGFHLGRSKVGWGLGETNRRGGGNEEEKKNKVGRRTGGGGEVGEEKKNRGTWVR